MNALFPVTATDTALTNDEWYTPRWLFLAAGLTFDLDVCAPVAPEFRTCPARRYLTVLEDGLTAPWDGLAWCNPPYSNPAPWVARLAHPDWLALVPPSTARWLGRFLTHADGITMFTIDHKQVAASAITRWGGFGRPDGSQVAYPTALILGARGPLAVAALSRVATIAPYAGGAYHVRPS